MYQIKEDYELSSYCNSQITCQGCRGECEIVHELFNVHKRPRYSMGDKLCCHCNIAYTTDKLRCFCCNQKLRVTPR